MIRSEREVHARQCQSCGEHGQVVALEVRISSVDKPTTLRLCVKKCMGKVPALVAGKLATGTQPGDADAWYP